MMKKLKRRIISDIIVLALIAGGLYYAYITIGEGVRTAIASCIGLLRV